MAEYYNKDEKITVEKVGGKYNVIAHHGGKIDTSNSFPKSNRGSNKNKARKNLGTSVNDLRAYVANNEWQYYTTIEPDETAKTYEDLKKYLDSMATFLKNQRNYDKNELEWLIVPDIKCKGKNNERWYMHLLLLNVPERIVQKLHEHEKAWGRMQWIALEKKHGKSNFKKVDAELQENLVKKLPIIILQKTGAVVPACNRLFFPSNNLTKRIVIARGQANPEKPVPRFETAKYGSKFSRSVKVDNEEEAMSYIAPEGGNQQKEAEPLLDGTENEFD